MNRRDLDNVAKSCDSPTPASSKGEGEPSIHINTYVHTKTNIRFYSKNFCDFLVHCNNFRLKDEILLPCFASN